MATTLPDSASLKPRQLQVARLRREEEEESWISGEELYTEGSSDDEVSARSRSDLRSECAIQSSSRAESALKQHCPAHRTTSSETPPSAASEPALQDDPHLTETTRRLSQMGMDELALAQGSSKGTDENEQLEEQEEVMLWRPKRGSIKIPDLELECPSPLLEQQSG